MSRRLGLSGGFLLVTLAATLVVACGDDDGGSDDTNGGEGGDTAGSNNGGSTSGGKAGSSNGGSTSGGKAGSSNGGKAGSSNGGSGSGGDLPEPVGGAGGSMEPVGGAGAAGEDGGGGEGGSPEPVYPQISKVRDEVFTQASDLRGLRFNKDGTKIWASGHIGINANPSVPADPDKQIVIARFNADGTPDTTFSGDGFLEVNLVTRVQSGDVITNDGNEESLGIVELGNGEIVVSANIRDVNGKGMDAALARFKADGTPVTTFGVDGLARVTFGWAPSDDATFPTAGSAPSDNSWGVELDSRDGTERLVVFGAGTAAKGQMTTGASPTQRTDNDRYVTRLLATDGAIDPGFNGGKAFTYHTKEALGDNGRRGIVEADGSILAGGYTNFGPKDGNNIVAIRLKPDGTADSSFGFGIVDDGVIKSNPLIDDGGVAECYAIVRQHSGRIITTGYGSATASGRLSSFGYVTTTAPDLVSVAFTANGKGVDEDWGNLGMLVVQSEEAGLARQEDRGRDLAVLSDDRVVYVGNYGTDPAIFVAMPTGDFDPTNDIGQMLRYDTTTGPEPRLPVTVTTNPQGVVTTSTSHFYRVAVSPDGKRIAASTSQNIKGSMLAVLKVGE